MTNLAHKYSSLHPEPQNALRNLNLVAIDWQDLPGWQQDDLQEFWPVFIEACQWLQKSSDQTIMHAWQPLWEKISDFHPASIEDIQAFFIHYFQPFAVKEQEGLFTGYFEPVFAGSDHYCEQYPVPIYRRPKDLFLIEDLGLFDQSLAGKRIAGRQNKNIITPYPTRAEINQGALEGQDLELAWVRTPIDAYVMAIQGSGCLRFSNTSSKHYTYAAANGHPYSSIGKLLIDRGEIPHDQVSMSAICQWLTNHPQQMHDVMWHNKSYIFFQETENDQQVGASGMQLTPERSLAIDPAFIPFATPLWVDIAHPQQSGRWRKMMMAQDKGSAIKGPVRGDVYWGSGQQAGNIASAMKSLGTYYVILPHDYLS